MLTRGISQETTLIEASLDDRPLKDGLHFLSGESGCFSGIGEGKAMKNTIYIYMGFWFPPPARIFSVTPTGLAGLSTRNSAAFARRMYVGIHRQMGKSREAIDSLNTPQNPKEHTSI